MVSITSVRVRSLEYDAGPLQRDKWGDRQAACLISIDGDNGLTGHALARTHFGTSSATLSEFIEHGLGRLVLGTDISDHFSLWTKMIHISNRQAVPLFPVSGIDVALWDLHGKTAGSSVAELLSPQHARLVEAYSSIPRIEDPELAAEEAARILSEGFSAVKLHSPPSFDADIQSNEELICATVRNRLGPRAIIMYDASCSMDRTSALRMSKVLSEYDFAWFEEPFPPFNSTSYAWLKDRTTIPLVGFETAPGGPAATEWAMHHGVFDKILVDCYWKGGITGAWQVVERGKALGHALCMHHGGSSSMNIANLHLVAAATEIDMVELLTPVDEYNKGVTMPSFSSTTPGLVVPTEPGLGCELDEEFINYHSVGHEIVIQ